MEGIAGSQNIKNKACEHLHTDVPWGEPGAFFIIIKCRSVWTHQCREQSLSAGSQSAIAEHQKQKNNHRGFVTVHGTEKTQKTQNKNDINPPKRLCETEILSQRTNKNGHQRCGDYIPDGKCKRQLCFRQRNVCFQIRLKCRHERRSPPRRRHQQYQRDD